MTDKVDFRIMSRHKCHDCDSPLKLNLVKKKQKYNDKTKQAELVKRVYCYDCWKEKYAKK